MPNSNLLDKLLRGSRLHEHPDPDHRMAGAARLPRDAVELIPLLGDPSADVRKVAAERCNVPLALASALPNENDPAVRATIVASLGDAIAATPDGARLHELLAAPECGDPVRVQVALRAVDGAVRRAAIEAIAGESALVDVALEADQAAVRSAAAERVHAPEHLARLLDGARDRDRGVARLARERLDAITRRAADAQAADALLLEAEALVEQPGDVLMAAVELDRRWRVLSPGVDAERQARFESVDRRLRERFERERDEQRGRAQFQARVNAWLAAFEGRPVAELPALRAELAELEADAATLGGPDAAQRLRAADDRLRQREQWAPRVAAAEALVAEAEELAAGTTIDDAQLHERWQALEVDVRSPALTQRLEAALQVIEQRRAAIVRASEEEHGAARHELHATLHQAEQAVAAGHVQEARAAADRVRALKLHAGVLPKPTVQRLSRMVNRLLELERWQQFGQQGARLQLCERAEALAQQALAPTALARDVQQLRAEWKKLDEQQPGVPKVLWERFDGACERAYAPAARHFAELAAQHKQARKQREEFIAAATGEGAARLGAAPPDWRGLEHWMRDTEAAWRGKSLGSVEPALWKKLDARFREALAPARSALRAARDQAIGEREAMIAEAQALLEKANERDTPTRVKELQGRWQAHAKSFVLPQKDERGLWERFRAAFQAVFDARAGQRKATDERRSAHGHALEALCERMERLAQAGDGDDGELRRMRHALQDEWRAALKEGPVPRALDERFKSAGGKVEQLLRGRGRRVEAAQWEALLAREALCSELDALAAADEEPASGTGDAVLARWSGLPAVPPEWEAAVAARRDAALQALHDADARYDHGKHVRAQADARRDALLELELMLGLESPPDLKTQRLAVQVRELRDRFKRTATGGAESASQVLLRWVALPGVAEARDGQRVEAIVGRLVGR